MSAARLCMHTYTQAAAPSLLHSARLAPPALLLVEPTGHAVHGGRPTVLLPPADHVPLAHVTQLAPPVPGAQGSAQTGAFEGFAVLRVPAETGSDAVRM